MHHELKPARHLPVSNLEVAGLLSARLAHSLSNCLSIIAGNLCAAGAATAPSDRGDALQAAISASNQAGMLLSRFVEFRRSIPTENKVTPMKHVPVLLREWVSRRPGWTFEVDDSLSGSELNALALPPEWLSFILTVVADESRSKSGTLQFRNSSAGRATTAVYASSFVEVLVKRDSGSLVFDWNDAQHDFSRPNLAAVCEIIRNAGTILESSEHAPERATIFRIAAVTP